MRLLKSILLTSVITGAVCGVAGCGDDEVISAGTEGTNTDVGKLEVLNLRVAAPSNGSYQQGDAALGRVTLLNDSDSAAVVAFGSSVADRVLIYPGTECPPIASAQDTIMVPPASDHPTSTDGLDEDEYWLRFVGLRDEVFAGTSVPVMIEFESRSQGVDALVQSPGETLVPPCDDMF